MYRNREESRSVIALTSIHYCTNKYAFIRRAKSKCIRTNKISFYMRERATHRRPDIDSIFYGSLRSTHNSKNGTCGLKTSDQLTPLSIRGTVRDAPRRALIVVSRVTISPFLLPLRAVARVRHPLSTLVGQRGSKHIDGRWRSTVARYTITRVLEGYESKY